MSTVDPTAALALLAAQKGELANIIKDTKGGVLASAKNAEATREQAVTALTAAPTPPTPPTPPAPPTGLQPTGISGNWVVAYDEEFDGETALNLSAWDPHNGWTNQNGVTDEASNIVVANGAATLTLSDTTHGAAMELTKYLVKVGDCAEAHINFKSNLVWAAFWLSGPGWPAAGEDDIFETLAQKASFNYHDLKGQAGPFYPVGSFYGGEHSYASRRNTSSDDYFWDGKLVATIPTADNGAPQSLILTMGQGTPGPNNAMVVNYVRIFTPA